MKGFIKKCALFAVLLFLCMGSSLCYAAESQGINVDYHTQKEIRAYLKKKKVDIYEETTYGTAASNTSSYQAGTMSDASLQSSLNTMNAIRYIAGIGEVQLDSTYTKKAQAAALVNSANSTLLHYPTQPSGMSSSLYQLGYEGARSSNLSWTSWKTGFGYHLVKAWMYDGDNSNVDRVGHRRWILNPSMEKTGFGWVSASNGTYAAMYAFDNWSGETSYYGVAWPAQNMPIEYFGSTYPWSISMGTAVDASKVKVTLTRKSDNKKWTFSKSKADGYFNVENSNYGKPGCIIFRPSSISYQVGDQFTVKITGLEQTVSYNVSFFSVDVDESTCSHSYGTAAVTKKATTTANGKKVSTCSKCGKTKTTTIYKASAITLTKSAVVYNGKKQTPKLSVKNSKGSTISSKNYTVAYSGTPKKTGIYKVTVKLKGDYSGKQELAFTINPKSVAIKKLNPLAAAVGITVQSGEDITGYEVCYSMDKSFETADTKTVVYKGKDKTKNKLSGLEAGTTYYIKVRTYKVTRYNGKKETIYSSWSKIKQVATL